MYIREITMDTVFVRRMPREDDEVQTYFVDEKIEKGTRTVVTTTDPLRAHLFSVKEVVEYTYNRMNERERERLINAHKENEPYGCLFSTVHERFDVIVPEAIHYGYTEDIKHEAILLDKIDMAYITGQEKLVIKDVDTL